MQDKALARWQLCEQGRKGGPAFYVSQGHVLLAEVCPKGLTFLVADGSIERRRTISLPGFKCFQDLFLGDVHFRRQLGNGRRVAEFLAQGPNYLTQLEVELLH